MVNVRVRLLQCVIVAFTAALVCVPASAETILRASHQFPGGTGDVRDEMVRLIAKEAHDANVGLTIQVYPGASLFKPGPQWDAMVSGQLDISLYSLDYASGEVPEFSAT
ncbi:MAG: TRAP transporter substrate-binding protein DctP, partial [Rhizomicrobium sp.]